MKKTEIPVEGLYILAFLVLISLAGTSLYFYIQGQSTARDYRISVGKILEESEAIKMLIDQERQFVLETVVFFLGSQGGVENIAEYNEYDLLKIALDDKTLECINNMSEMNNGMYPSNEVLSKCLTSKDFYKYEEGLGAWKCDNYLYSYENCNFSMQSPCCAGLGNTICHEGCLTALDYDISKCSNKNYCGALWCKDNNLEIPETYQGVQYYSKIQNQMPGYFCDSILSYNPEGTYSSKIWGSIDSTTIINNLIKLSNEYFYLPYPKFSESLKNIYNRDLIVTFQLNFKGCNDELCEFSWVPYGAPDQKFVVKGLNGIPIVELSNQILSLQSLKVPIFDLIKTSKSFVENKEIKNSFSELLKEQVLITKDVTNPNNFKYLSNWKNELSESLGINPSSSLMGTDESVMKFDLYDNSLCGDEPYANNSYDCLMQHLSTKIYDTISDPMILDSSKNNYNLRPIFNFVKTSLGASLQLSSCGNSVCEYTETLANCPNDCNYGATNYPDCEYITNNENIKSNLSVFKICIDFFKNNPIYSEDDCIDAFNFGQKKFEESNLGLYHCQTFKKYLDSARDENPNTYFSENDNECRHFLLAKDCEYTYKDNGICEYGENPINNPNDCQKLICGDGILSTNETCPTDEKIFSMPITLSQGKYVIFLKGIGPNSGRVQGTLTVGGQVINFDIYSSTNFYDTIRPFESLIGRCAYNPYIANKTLEYYESFGCCPSDKYTPNGCIIKVAENNYCKIVNNGYGRSQIGAYCKRTGGAIDYENNFGNVFNLGGDMQLELSVTQGVIEAVDFIRVKYDGTYPIIQQSNQGILRTTGGSPDYYTEPKDCESKMGNANIQFSSLNSQEAWYSLLCLRAQGKNWVNIIENYTGIYEVYKTLFLTNYESQKIKIDNFIKKYDLEKTYDYTAKKVAIKFFSCDSPNNDCGIMNLEKSQNTFIYSEPFLSYAVDESVFQRLIQIQTQTSYLPLPIKWIFAYNDKVNINSNEPAINNANCQLSYSDGKSSAPDCGCKLNCEENYQCEFDFSDIHPYILKDELYAFEEIFINNIQYKDNGVVSE
ncbi:MAG: hypothetical protein PHN56_04930 [Candidatus Nanoarchaeia archaeon]|nr:hypothetical protein [Candidatus Nanoarchaeia archaeon]